MAAADKDRHDCFSAVANGMKRIVLLSFLIIGSPVMSGLDFAEAANDPRAAQLTYEPWAKNCFHQADGNSQCFVLRGATGGCFPSGGAFGVIVGPNGTFEMEASFRTKYKLEGAIRIQIDQDSPILLAHPECKGISCFGRLEIDSAFIEHLKNARTINVQATTSRGHQLGLSPSPLGFAKAFDGPEAPTPKVVEVTQDEMNKFLKQREEHKIPECEE